MNQPANNKKLLDFLLYSYFGCSSEDSEQTVKKKCAYRAYLDLARTVKYVYSSTELEKATVGTDAHAFIDIRKKRIEAVCYKLIESIEGYPNHSGGFDTWHESKCAQIIDRMNAPYGDGKKGFLKARFTYGQAQKWVNMTLKYLWLLDMLPEGLTEKSLHVPIDSFILEKLQEENVDEIKRDGDTYKYKGKTWSQLDDYDVYLDIQAKIGQIAGKTFPIEWEGPAWMDVAKTRSSK